MKVFKIIFLMVVVLFTGVTTSSAQTPNCHSSAKFVSKMWDSFKGKIPSNYNQYLQKADAAIQDFNAGVANNGWGTIGPRAMKIPTGGVMRGTVIGGTNRMFISPPAFHNNVKITLRKLGGKAKTGVSICIRDKKGALVRVQDYHFPKGRYKRNIDLIVPNAKGKVVSVNIRNYAATVVGWKFKYDIKAVGF